MLTSKAIECCAVLSNEARYAIVRALVDAGQEGLSLRGLSLELELSRATIKRHIRRLRNTGLVNTERQQSAVVCRADTEKLTEFLNSLRRSFEADWSPKQRTPSPTRNMRHSLRDRLRKIELQKSPH